MAIITPFTTLLDALRQAAVPLTGSQSDYDSLLDRVGDARFVLIGEASHGTHEFYEQRALITQRLIQEKGFAAVAVEADWPDSYRVNRYVRGESDDPDSDTALSGFERFPTWMWRNTEVLNFVNWLRSYNDALPPGGNKAGFYGLDLYSLYASIDAVLTYLDQVDPEAAMRARYRYSCMEQFGRDSETYGYAAVIGAIEACEDEVVNQLLELQRRSTEYLKQDGVQAEDAFFYAEQNARVVRDAEQYYRAMFRSGVRSWNLRDQHMADTLDALINHLEKRQAPAKIVVWAHNSHLGDARATELGAGGELNVGQLVRERYGPDCVLVGLTTYTGTVTAASDWGGPFWRKQVRPALPGSYEALFHDTGLPRFLLKLSGGREIPGLMESRLERAIGVIYRPETERISHYFEARLPDQFDAVLHFDETQALEPLEPTAQWLTGEVPETFPTGQ
jgi:erythromycin esterase-like protein